MNNIKTTFSIKDLENLSGIKAHTIRIWEKRYNLFEPIRSETNIRSYNIESLQKLLNVVYLNNNGYKISKIANLEAVEIPSLVREIASRGNQRHHALNALKVAMLNFNLSLFQTTYNNLLQELSFRDIFYTIFVPFLEEIGLLWQTDTISPAHEHFITTLIKQKVLINIEKVQSLEPQNDSRTYVLFLPDHEIHDIGLLYMNYEIVCKGYQCIYLGPSVPTNCLTDLTELYDNVVFVTYFTVKPEAEELAAYLDNFYSDIIDGSSHKLCILGQRAQLIDMAKIPEDISVFRSISDLVKEL